MRKLTPIAAIALLIGGAGTLAFQSTLPKLGLTAKDVETWATGLVDPKAGAMAQQSSLDDTKGPINRIIRTRSAT